MNAIEFTGTGDVLRAPNFTGNPAAFSVSFWVRVSSPSTLASTLFGNYQGSGSFGWVVGFSDSLDGRLKLYLGSSTLSGSSDFRTSLWRHVLATFDGTTAKIYVNGNTTPEVTLTSSASYGSVPTYNTLGYADNSGTIFQQFGGRIAALGVWSKALTASDAAALYNSGSGLAYAQLTGGFLTSLDGYYDFDNASSLGLDSTANHHDFSFVASGTGVTQAAGPVGSGPQIITVSATTTIHAIGTGGGFRDNAIKTVSATTQVTLSSTNSVSAVWGGPRNLTVDASTGIKLAAGASGGEAHILFVDAVDRINLRDGGDGGANSTFRVNAASSFLIGGRASEYVSPIHRSAITTINIAGHAPVQGVLTKEVSAFTGIVINPQADSDGQVRVIAVDATTLVAIEADAVGFQHRIIGVSAITSFNAYSNTHVAGDRLVGATTGINFRDGAVRISEILVDATTSFLLTSSARSNGRDIGVSATTGLGLSSGDDSNQFPMPTAITTVSIVGSAGATIGWNGAKNSIAIRDIATAFVELPGGGSVPGGDANSGLRAVAYPVVSGTWPFSYAETPSGLLLLANGVDPMLKWDGLKGVASTAGIQPPTVPLHLAGADEGTIVGMRYAMVRFVDDQGNCSAPSPLSNAANLGRDGAVEDITLDLVAARCTILSRGHGLAPTDIVVVQGVNGLPVNGGRHTTTIDQDRFRLTNAVVSGGQWSGGGSWTWGVARVVYQDVPISADPKVVRRQILRNLDGSADVFYVDVDTTDLLSTELESTRDDESLSACEAVPIITASNELPFAGRYEPPPSHKSIIASHSGRIFACGEVSITAGNVAPLFGSASVQGIGVDWPATLAGRLLYVTGAKRSYEIASVDVANNRLVLTTPYLDPSAPYATYAIRPAPGERRLVYYTEPGLPEVWPPWNAFAIPEEDDEIVGMFGRTGFLYFLEKRHIHRFTMQDEPSEGEVFASINRGAINGRCFVQVENTSYLLDEAGIHAFDGGQSTDPISTPIQTIFQSDGLLGGLIVDWSADTTLWHASHDPVRNTVRWFVQMREFHAIHHAICYDYRQRRWWIEQYPSPITSSTTGVVGYRRALCGTDARRVIALGEGALDLVADAATGLSGTVTDADSTSLTDANASFPANLAGAPVSIATGAGRRQQRIVAENTSTTLTVVEPWDTVPDWTSGYQVGGVQWSYRSGWFEYLTAEEDSNPRDVMITYQPTASPASIDMQLFYDHSADPRLWAFGIDQDGVSVVAGEPDMTVNLQTRSCRSGWSLQRLGGHSDVYGYGEQFVQILLAGVQCAESIRVYQVTIDGASPPEGS